MTHIKDKILRLIATLGASAVLAGSVGVASASVSHNNYRDHHKDDGNSTVVENKNDVDVDNEVNQNAQSGDAKVIAEKDNNHHDKRCHRHCDDDSSPAVLGDATSGDASNDASVSMSIDLSNEGSCGCAPAESSRHSSSSVKIENENEVEVDNSVNQNAQTGDATVYGGSEGSATSGNASNSASVTINVSGSNN